MIEAVLLLQACCHSLGDGLNDDDRGAGGIWPDRGVVHLPDNPIYERAKEVAFAKLNNALRTLSLGCGGGVEGFHRKRPTPNPSRKGGETG